MVGVLDHKVSPALVFVLLFLSFSGVILSWMKDIPALGHEHELRKILSLLEKLYARLAPKSATLSFGEKGMPATIQVGKQAQSNFKEWSGPNGTGTELPPVGPVSFSSDNPAVATVDPTSGVATGVAPGTANISGTDGGNNLTASDVLTVSAPVAQSATLTLTPL